MLALHSGIFWIKFHVVIANSNSLLVLFARNFILFYKYLVFRLFVGSGDALLVSKIKWVYFTSHVFLALLFPLVITIGTVFSDYRAMLMWSISVCTGIFSIYITFFIERPIPSFKNTERTLYRSGSQCLDNKMKS